MIGNILYIALCILGVLCLIMAVGSVIIFISGIRTIKNDLKECSDKSAARMIISSLIHDALLVIAMIAAVIGIVLVGFKSV